GGSVGVAVYGSIFVGQFSAWMPRLVPADLRGRLDPGSLQASPPVVQGLPAAARGAVAEAVAHGLSAVFLVAAPIAAVGFLLVLFLEERPLRERRQPESGPATSRPPVEPASRPAQWSAGTRS